MSETVTWYLTLQPPRDRPEAIDTEPVVAFLASQVELLQTGPVAFESAPGQPWLQVVLAKTGPMGGYSSDGSFIPQIDVVELLCGDDGPGQFYEGLAVRIAQFLDWQAVEEHEQRQLWPPAPS